MLYQFNHDYLYTLREECDRRTATFKPREDICNILENSNIESLKIDVSKREKSQNKLSYFNNIKKSNRINYTNFLDATSTLNGDDVLIIQYPLGFEMDFAKGLTKLKNKGVKIVLFLHDLENLRRANLNMLSAIINNVKIFIGLEFNNSDMKILKYADLLIVHNDAMINFIHENYSVDYCKMFSLDIFDYLEDENSKAKNLKDEIIFAGNLSNKKAGFLHDLPNNVKFGLYGIGYNGENTDNINYYGSFPSNEILTNLDGKYGLIWDGETSNTCVGSFGKYLKYNNPYKASLYLAGGLPIIAWSQSAIAKFVLDNNCGFVIDSLNDIKPKLDCIDEEQYLNLKNNAYEIGKKLKKGFFTKRVMDRVVKKLNGD